MFNMVFYPCHVTASCRTPKEKICTDTEFKYHDNRSFRSIVGMGLCVVPLSDIMIK